MGGVDIEAARRFVRENHRAIFATRRRDGRPQLSPVVCGLDRDDVVISSRETAVKVKNVRRDPDVSLCVFGEAFYGPWAQLDGRATIESLPEAMEGLVRYYRDLSGEHPDWDEYRDAMHREQRCLIRVAVTRAGPNISG
jgi:PPOX class probable F420-dependent enzyme